MTMPSLPSATPNTQTQNYLPTYEEACLCPRCSQAGSVRVKNAAPPDAHLPRGTQIHLVYCENKECRWYNTPWTVQVNADGSVPAPRDHTKEPKLYAGFEGHDRQAEEIVKALKKNAELETNPGGRELPGRG